MTLFYYRINVDLKSTVYCTAIENGGEEEWNFGWERYVNGNVDSEKATLRNALACTREVWILNR